jgi:hypothetical protein
MSSGQNFSYIDEGKKGWAGLFVLSFTVSHFHLSTNIVTIRLISEK